ncbi:MAG TPA: metallophosphoesterase [Myxococcaceae bacterium]|nr:metallophosphoesterase [Myxococcaceae bacterium]
MIRVAHVSDLHVLSRTGTRWRQIIFNKRITGYANLLLHRGRVHRRDYLLQVLAGAAAAADQLVVTGDITNLALEHEYQDAAALLAEAARKTEVTAIPGNHDIYLPSLAHEKRFAHHFHPFLGTDLPELAVEVPAGRFPTVKLRQGLAIIGLSSGVPRPPFVSAGRLGATQLRALQTVLAHPEVRRRCAVVLVHHPPVDGRPRWLRLRDGLVDLPALQRVLAPLGRGVLLFGHLHLRLRRELRTQSGRLEVIGASGAALDHPDPAVRAGFNLYRFEDDGTLVSIEAHVLDPEGGGMQIMPISENGESR